ncbi:MAG: class I SAM-dependent methyltransferase [Candidatus Omnitrophica bacterium]|nr:class I SAM-dependent methyltransferase [Candidatus Omnitrophota bacterium]
MFKSTLQRIPGARLLIRLFRRLARPGRFLVWHTPHEPFRSNLIESAREEFGPPFLDIASGTRRLGPDFLNLDLNPNSQVDVLGDAGDLPFRSDTFGLVSLEAALEHVPDPVSVVAEIDRVLKPRGWVYVEIPFMQGYHADPGDYQRFTIEGLKRLFHSFEIEWIAPCSGPASAFCYSGASFFATLFSFHSRWLYKIWFHYVFSYLFFPLKFLDRILIAHPEAHRTAFGYALLARAKSCEDGGDVFP